MQLSKITLAKNMPMQSKFNPGDIAYIVESNLYIREVEVVKAAAGFFTIRFADHGGGIKVRESRLFPSKEAAEASLPKKESPKKSHWSY